VTLRRTSLARTEHERDGLTKAQAEERFREMRQEHKPPPADARVTMAQAGTGRSRFESWRGHWLKSPLIGSEAS